jgi:tyrosinase
MTQGRREFLQTVMASAGWGLLGGCATSIQQCQEAIANRPVRRNVSGLAASDPLIVAYKSAIAQMKALPLSDPRNWTRQAQIHNDFCPHGNWLFLPWHRAYLLYFERICRKLSGMAEFALPYWNWSTAPSVPAAFWGGSSNPMFNPTRRATAASVAEAANIGPGVVGPIVHEPNFLVFGSGSIAASASQRASGGYGTLEGTPHNYVHGFVGGDMGGYMSPLDPVFWAHHNMIERCWVERNFVHNLPNPSDRAWLDRELTEFCDENGNPVRISVATTLLFPVFSYRYDDVGPGGPAPARTIARDTKAMQLQNERVAKAGAAVRLDLQRKFSAPQPVSAAIGQPASARIAVEPQAVKVARDTAGRTFLVLAGTSMEHTEDFSVRVFVNKPDASPETPVTDPHFAGAFAFFNHSGPGHDHGAAGGDFTIDASDTLRRLAIDGGPIEVNLVVVPFPDRQPRTRALSIRSAELRIVKDVVDRQP